MNKCVAVGRGFISFAKEYQSDENKPVRENAVKVLMDEGFTVTVMLSKNKAPKYTISFPTGEYSEKTIESLNKISPFLLEGKITFCECGNDNCAYTVWQLSCSYGKEWSCEIINE